MSKDKKKRVTLSFKLIMDIGDEEYNEFEEQVLKDKGFRTIVNLEDGETDINTIYAKARIGVDNVSLVNEEFVNNEWREIED